MSELVRRALDAAGLLRVLTLRNNRVELEGMRAEVEKADWILLGALANVIRAVEVGDRVRVSANASVAVTQSDLRGLAFLRSISLARIFSAPGATIGVDFEQVGLELAQVALSFGANELCGEMRNKRGATIAEDELGGVGRRSKRLPLATIKKRELTDVLAAAGRTVEFVEAR